VVRACLGALCLIASAIRSAEYSIIDNSCLKATPSMYFMLFILPRVRGDCFPIKDTSDTFSLIPMPEKELEFSAYL
jgi:hypothetical protein